MLRNALVLFLSLWLGLIVGYMMLQTKHNIDMKIIEWNRSR